MGLQDNGKNTLRTIQGGQGREDAVGATKGGNVQRRSKMTLMLWFTPFMVGRQHQALDAGRMMKKRIVHWFGALDDEGAFSVASPLISEEFSNARRLRARQRGGR